MESLKKLAGQNISKLRRKKSLTQEQLAEKTGLGLATIQRYEAGQRWPRAENAMLLAKALGVSENKIFIKDTDSEQMASLELLSREVDRLNKEIKRLKMQTESIPDEFWEYAPLIKNWSAVMSAALASAQYEKKKKKTQKFSS